MYFYVRMYLVLLYHTAVIVSIPHIAVSVATLCAFVCALFKWCDF